MSLLFDENTETLKVWAIASNGDALYRRGVTKSSPAGSTWEHITANNQPLVSISISKVTGVWAIGRSGKLFGFFFQLKFFENVFNVSNFELFQQDQHIDDMVFHRKMSVAHVGKQSKMHQKELFLNRYQWEI